MSLLDVLTGGKSGEATADEKQALQALLGVGVPTQQQLSLPELQQYAVSQNMTPAQTQAFLQQYNALANENVNQQGTAAQQAALAQLGQVANAGAAGTPVEQAQIAQALQQSNQNLAGQRGAIDQAAQARGVAPGLLQAALAQQNAGQDAQNANQAALQAQSQAYQTALNAMTGQAGVGQALQGQQNQQANTVAQAQNAMQQFNAANQQQATNVNAGYKQAANAYNTGMANQVGQQNTGLANQRTMYNAQVPETVFQNQMQKAGGLAGQYGNMANTATGQGQQNAGLLGGLIGAGATAFGGPGAGMAASGALYGGAPPASANTQQYAPQGPGNSLNYAEGGSVPEKIDWSIYDKNRSFPLEYNENGTPPVSTNPQESLLSRIWDNLNFQGTNKAALLGIPGIGAVLGSGSRLNDPQYACGGRVDYKSGGPVPGQAKHPGNDPRNDTVHAKLSPGEFVVPNSITQNHPEDVAALLAAMRHLRGQNAPR